MQVKDAHLKLYNYSLIGKRSQKVGDRIAKEMKLIRAMEIRKQNILNKQKTELIEPSINNKTDEEEKPLGSKQLFKIELKKNY